MKLKRASVALLATVGISAFGCEMDGPQTEPQAALTSSQAAQTDVVKQASNDACQVDETPAEMHVEFPVLQRDLHLDGWHWNWTDVVHDCGITWEDECTHDGGFIHGIVDVSAWDPEEEMRGQAGDFHSDYIWVDWFGLMLDLDAASSGPRRYTITVGLIDGAGNWSDASCDIVVVGGDDDCDGYDDDHDGVADDDFLGVAVQCGHGHCASLGHTACVEGEVVNICEEGPAPHEGGEQCGNHEDDDCDGQIDEGCDEDEDEDEDIDEDIDEGADEEEEPIVEGCEESCEILFECYEGEYPMDECMDDCIEFDDEVENECIIAFGCDEDAIDACYEAGGCDEEAGIICDEEGGEIVRPDVPDVSCEEVCMVMEECGGELSFANCMDGCEEADDAVLNACRVELWCNERAIDACVEAGGPEALD